MVALRALGPLYASGLLRAAGSRLQLLAHGPRDNILVLRLELVAKDMGGPVMRVVPQPVPLHQLHGGMQNVLQRHGAQRAGVPPRRSQAGQHRLRQWRHHLVRRQSTEVISVAILTVEVAHGRSEACQPGVAQALPRERTVQRETSGASSSSEGAQEPPVVHERGQAQVRSVVEHWPQRFDSEGALGRPLAATVFVLIILWSFIVRSLFRGAIGPGIGVQVRPEAAFKSWTE
eukprot:7319901-Pyramimonas_sp.AAC.1